MTKIYFPKKNINLSKSPENKTKQKSNHFMLFILFCKRKYSVRSVIIFHLKLLIQMRLLLVWQPVELLLSINIKVFINSLVYILVDHMRHKYRLHFQKELYILQKSSCLHLLLNFNRTKINNKITKMESRVALSRIASNQP